MSQPTRTYALCVYEILKEYSDEQHKLSSSRIIELLQSKYQINLDIRTVRSNIEALIEFGFDIELYNENRKGYFLREREFIDSEIQLLCNCVHSAHYIPDKYSNEIIKKLSRMQSKFKRSIFREQVYIKNTKKHENKDLFLNIETLMDAISSKKVVVCNYLHYNYSKQLVRKRDKPYTIHPYYIVQENDNLYLICKHDKYDDLSHYRIDKMNNIEIIEQSVSPLKQSFDPYEYTRRRKFMYSGDDTKITLRCHRTMLDDLIDQFGQDIRIVPDPHDNEFFHAQIQATAQGIFYFALQYLSYCEVIEPVSLRLKIADTLKEKHSLYSS